MLARRPELIRPRIVKNFKVLERGRKKQEGEEDESFLHKVNVCAWSTGDSTDGVEGEILKRANKVLRAFVQKTYIR